MSVVAIGGTAPVERTARPRWMMPAVGAALLVALQLALRSLDRFDEFPESLYIHLADPIDELQDWIQDEPPHLPAVHVVPRAVPTLRQRHARLAHRLLPRAAVVHVARRRVRV